MKIFTNLIIGGVLLATTGSAFALQASGGSFTAGPQTTELSSSNANGLLAQFDTSLPGVTLNFVTISVSAETVSQLLLTNNAATAASVGFTSDIDWFFEIALGSNNFYGINIAGVPTVNTGPAFSATLFDTANEPDANFLGKITLASGETRDFGTVTVNDSIDYVFTGADMAPFIGNSFFGIGCNTRIITGISGGGGNIDPNQNTTGECTASVVYDYGQATVTIPTPAPLALVALSLIGFAAKRRRFF